MICHLRLQILFLLSLIAISGYAQVGIGTTNPTVQLEIVAANTGIPALGLSTQTAPVGTASGQIAVIDNELFMYDLSRGKWLSISSTALQFGIDESDGHFLFFGGTVGDDNGGALMPFNGTIVYVTAKSTGGEDDKKLYLYVNGSKIPEDVNPNLSGEFDLSNLAYSRTTYNIDFNAGDHFSTRTSSAGDSSDNISVIIWVKWRK